MAFNLTLRKLYLYLFSIIGLILMITGSISLINLGLKVFVFKQADNYPIFVEKRVPTNVPGEDRELSEEELAQRRAEEEQRQQAQRTSDRQRQAAQAVAQLLVGVPLYAYHWSMIRKEGQI